MYINKVTGLLVLLCSDLCLTLRVPIVWDESGNSAVKIEPSGQVENVVETQNVKTLHQSKPIPIEYFQYTAQKPRFAADIAAFHGVKNPHQHYKAYPIEPFTGNKAPVFGTHQLLNEDKTIYQPYQKYVQKTEEIKNHVRPASTGYEVFHPYKIETPALQDIYKDPILNKIRHDLEDSKNRLQTYEQESGNPNIADDEYLEGQEKTDSKLFPQKNVPARYEIHRPERRPIYYNAPPRDTYRDKILDQRFKHPWNQHNIKIRPTHYRPLKNHIHHLRQHHAMKYDDERNEYPQIILSEDLTEPQEGYDIYEKGKQKFKHLRDHVDESLNRAVQQNRPVPYQKLELQKDEPKNIDEEDEFIPIKNYAQVRKTETFKHLPKKSAFDDAETLEEILNAPRLREAVKSTKAQTVYSEEGYEDSAYDHAGEQKHASDHEGHGGFLKEHEKSQGLYKIPTVQGNYDDSRGSEYRDKKEHGKKWKNENENDETQTDSEDYSENNYDEDSDAEVFDDQVPNDGSRNKRGGKGLDSSEASSVTNEKLAEDRLDNNSDVNSDSTNQEANDTISQHEVDKRETKFQIPEINLNSTYLTEEEILKLAKLKIIPKKDNLNEKYPYYFKNIKSINKNSPLRYAENMKLIPKKSSGGTEFYDSRSIFECPEVDDDVDPLPEKLKNGENPTENDEEDTDSDNQEPSNKGEKTFDIVKKQPRLKGLGDKIDCFKAKYFGENPLDSPFFKEEIISNPEPITAPKLPIYIQLGNSKKENIQESSTKIDSIELPKRYKGSANTNIYVLLDKLRADKNQLQGYLNKTKEDIETELYTPHGALGRNNKQKSNIYDDLLSNIKNESKLPSININVLAGLIDRKKDIANVTYNFFQSKDEVAKLPPVLRMKRATPFVYEPYKIIRDSQYQDSKKTTTTNNISPLIRQLQSSRVADRVSRSNHDNRQVKPSNNRTYIDVGKSDRSKNVTIPAIVDVSMDHRRGEPRYEVRPANHKSEYTPVENVKAISVNDYKNQATTERNLVTTLRTQKTRMVANRGTQRFRPVTDELPFYDVPLVRRTTKEIPKVAASNAVRKRVRTTTPAAVLQKLQWFEVNPDDDSTEISGEEISYEASEEKEISVSSTTTPKPSFRRRIRTTTETPQSTDEDEPDKLELVTRFKNYKPRKQIEAIVQVTDPQFMKYEDENIKMPKYREKKKKTSKSTLVTDTKKYGNDGIDEEDDEKRKEIDDMMRIKHNMDDYKPSYELQMREDEILLEKEIDKRNKNNDDNNDSNNEDDDSDDDDDDNRGDDDNSGNNHNIGDDDEEYEEHDGEEEDDSDEDEIESKDNHDGDNDDEEEGDDEGDDEGEDDDDEEVKINKTEITTLEPTESTLVLTTDAPLTTDASYELNTYKPVISRNIKQEPIITKKKIEIHKELPVNKSSPHITEFKEDFKEVEIIKEMPPLRRRPQKKPEALELYKDDNLAKEINTLGDVDIFTDYIELEKGPKHGGNYRKATKEDLTLLTLQSQESSTQPPKDAEASQSENQKHLELEEYNVPNQMHGGNLKSLSDIKRTRTKGQNAKLIELSEKQMEPMHGGNLQYEDRQRGEREKEKFIEIADDILYDYSAPIESFRPSNDKNVRLHGGNYRNAKLTEDRQKGERGETEEIKVRASSKEERRNAAALLNSFAQAVPVLTTSTPFIVDPSKRMYYYVDT